MSPKYARLKKISVLCLGSLLILSQSLSLSVASETSEGLPGRRTGGGSRGCQELQGLTPIDPKQLIALIPQDNLGKTVADYPTFFFRIPKLPSGKPLEFVLRDDHDQRVYKTTFQSPNTGGVLSVPLPASATLPLAVGTPYHWYFSIICDASDRAKDIFIEGNIQRVPLAPSLTDRLQQSSPSEQVELFLTNDLWQDALETVITLRRERPQDSAIASKWMKVLKSAGLDAISQESILSQSQSAQTVSIKP